MIPTKKSKNSTLWYLILFITLIFIINVYLFAPHKTEINYSDFQSLLKAGAIQQVSLGEQDITAMVDPHLLTAAHLPLEKINEITQPNGDQYQVMTTTIHDPALIQQLEEKNIIISGQTNSEWVPLIKMWLIPFLFFMIILLLTFRRSNQSHNVLGIEKSKAKIYSEKNCQVTFNDVAGIDEVKNELIEIVEFLKRPNHFRRLGAHIPKGILLLGAPGTGKTLLARAVAGEAGVPFFSINGSEFVELFVGVGAARVRNLFQEAHANAPAIIFIDEVDALGRARNAYSLSGGNDEKEQTLNQLLSEMDGFNLQENVIVLAATNRPEILDPALLRAGRFDRQILLDLPDKIGRIQILTVHLRKIKKESNLNIENIAMLTPGFSGADLANLVNEATLTATHRGAEAVNLADFTKSVERIVAGIEKKNRIMNPTERRFIAFHEMGHALVSAKLQGIHSIQKISIIPRGIKALGYTIQRPTEDRYVMTQDELQIKLTIILAGRAAEYLMFKHISTGGADDLAKASNIAHSMIMQYGMDETLGHVVYEHAHSALLRVSPELVPHSRDFSEKTAEKIDTAIQNITNKAFEEATYIIKKYQHVFVHGSELLLEKETLDENDLAELLKPVSISID